MTTSIPAQLRQDAAIPARVRRRHRRAEETDDRGILSDADRHTPGLRVFAPIVNVLLGVSLVVAGLLPLLWLMKSAVTPTQETLTNPLAILPQEWAWSNLAKAWNDVHIGDFFFNTIAMAAGSWAVQLLVATTGGFALAVLRPKYGKVISALVLATLFIPSVVLLVPLYLTVLNPPLIGHSLINTFWAVWLPAGASAFNVLLVMRFFGSLPREIFEAARTDGAGTFRLFWSVVLPMSRPILGVVSILAINASWADFLWPNLVLKDIGIQPLSVRLPQIAASTDLGVYLAALMIATLIPVVIFLVFQRAFLNSGGIGGAVKG
ncbi:carbohydrate ABC transporter permease [Microbacterium horticulturae]|uniref:Carbohydrate ABC transporter permease n=1 Tax=Microbacterium horticulturae TaxID=3028316 RepID=A0ABY8C142_9MICO|nr:carbohydrate ABC transporter permease [Microbacterium sp. KACC 23027]WEG09467.1 carbohydrate ABC transporter permease [Microbacterium sp. KACC 23027]